MKKLRVRGLPSWMNKRIQNKKGRLILRGNKTWVSQPVINTVRVRLTDDITGVNVNRGMMASWRFKGNDRRNTFVFGDQAGAITKRSRSVIDFGVDDVRDRFVFKNTTKKEGPFNHMQNFVIKNFGKEDVIRLQNIGKTFRADDLRRIGKNRYSLPGVPPTSLTVISDLL